MKKIIAKNLLMPTRVDLFIKDQLNCSRSKITNLIANKKVFVNQISVDKPGVMIHENDIIEYDETIVEELKQSIKQTPLDIVYQDDYLLVINKPKNMLVHPTPYDDANTIVNNLKGVIDFNNFTDQTRPGIVHRLDKNTSGLMVIAKNQKVLDSLQKQIISNQLKRKYKALVHGHFNDKHLMIKTPIIRCSDNTTKMVVSDDPKALPAITEVILIDNLKQEMALVECILHTGRTHQIRVHLKYIHHPIFNDTLYGCDDDYKGYEQFLHAYSLGFIHPITKKHMNFSIELEPTFAKVLKVYQ